MDQKLQQYSTISSGLATSARASTVLKMGKTGNLFEKKRNSVFEKPRNSVGIHDQKSRYKDQSIEYFEDPTESLEEIPSVKHKNSGPFL